MQTPPTRRDFLRTSSLAAAAFCTRGALQAAAAGPRDRFGGWRALAFEATGFFRLERRERWWFVTPEGHAWLGFGMNHVSPNWLNQSYNAPVWLQRFGAERYNDEAWRRGLQEKVRGDLALCGFNHFGVHNDFGAVAGMEVPEIRRVDFVKIPHYLVATEKEFPDVFAPEFTRHCAALAERQIAPHRGNPFIVGWAFTDCPILTDAEAAERPVVTQSAARAATPTWPRVLRNLPGAAPGKQAWLETIRGRYADRIGRFNDCYGTSFRSWSELAEAQRWRLLTDMANARELADNRAFLARVIDRYYAVACGAVRAAAPRHLVFGDKLNANTDGADFAIPLTTRHTDLVFYQMYERWDQQRATLDRWRTLTDKPHFNGDGTFSTTSEMMPNPHGPHADNQAERGEWAHDFGRNAFARPDFVGWSVCGWADTWKTMPGKEHKQHSGFFGPQGEVHEPYARRLRDVSDNLYAFASVK